MGSDQTIRMILNKICAGITKLGSLLVILYNIYIHKIK